MSLGQTDDEMWGQYQTQPRDEPTAFPEDQAPPPGAQEWEQLRCLQLANMEGAKAACADTSCRQFNPTVCAEMNRSSMVTKVLIGGAIVGLAFLAYKMVPK